MSDSYSLAHFPVEIIEIICHQLARSDLARFMRTSKFLRKVGERILYRLTTKDRLQVMTWAGSRGQEATMLQVLDDLLLRPIALVGPQILPCAAQGGCPEALSRILAAGADPNAKFNGSYPVLNAAAGQYPGCVEVVRLLLNKGANPYVIDDGSRYNALHWAARTGNTAIMRILLDAGMDVDIAGLRDNTPLILAAKNGRYRACELLVGLGADVNHVNEDERSPLLYAAEAGVLSIVRLLLDHGADINFARATGKTALSIAAGRGDINIVEALVNAGCDVNLKDWYGRRAIDYAISNGPCFPWSMVCEIIRSAPGFEL
ncbi:ankyrin repeat-containing domain protein [Aspergillus egyptiacus]|nr:ankyrin repeat-containing domain protein [Aspergillus egyptiacus]